ncbi:MAG TPA: response regulator [Polyangiaceae bacterium]
MARVLVIDDDPSQARQVALALQVEGIDSCVACGAGEAFAALEASPVEMVLLELMLPGTNGLDLARQVHERFPEVRIVLTGAYHLSERQLLRSDCGAMAFVPKPFEARAVAGFLRSKMPAPPPSVRRLCPTGS